MITTEDRSDLHTESRTLVYEWIKLTNLSSKLTNEQADALTDQIATNVDREIETRVDEVFTRIEGGEVSLIF